MVKDLTFKEVSKFIKRDDSSLIDAVEKLIGAFIVLSPLVLGPQATPIWGALGIKGELTNIAKTLIDKVRSKEETNFLSRMERMQIAYGLICFTAFFDALDRLTPTELRKEIDLKPREKVLLSVKATGKGKKGQKKEKHSDIHEIGISQENFLEVLIPFPHPAAEYEDLTKHLMQLYILMAKGFGEFLQKLALGEEKDEKISAQIGVIVEKLPTEALECFEAQYLELARSYLDFCVWSRIHEHKTTQGKLKDISEYLKSYASLIKESDKRIDVGFEKLQKTISTLPESFKQVEASNIVDGLRRHYAARINEPIIEDKYEPKNGGAALNFPKISEAFVPQSYRALIYDHRKVHLEREETWNALNPKNDLGGFLLGYLSSPYSIETPLLILGYPGSGKSLLTKVLCAKLISDAYTPIRVPLREVNAESPIESQIEDQIYRVTGSRISSWSNFSSQFYQRPLVIILDGFDELLQASGKVFAGYLKNVQQFQQREAEQGRPVRLIVTSRIALIDKAIVPDDSTILRLLDFNEKQRNAWINIWNKANTKYFLSFDPPLQQFEIPNEKKILELAEQPLLLLMLALYDSDENSLRNKTQLDRTVLYDSLLRRFVSREKRKDTDFDNLPQKEQQKILDQEMKRLGVAAIGMYNRRKLHIQASELGSDLAFFRFEHASSVDSDRPMTAADLLLGSFFFIHKSSAGQKVEVSAKYGDQDTAFEFLHNTFGEFLTADFILRFAFQETEALDSLRKNDSLHAEFQRKLQSPNGLVKEWFACLMYSPLYSRPVVLEMLREWPIICFKKMREAEKIS
jgi:hypothetical protein